MESLQGRRLLVTGAAKNIGLAISRSALEAGARVMLMDLRQSALDEARALLGPELSGRAIFFEADVRDRERVEAGVARMTEAWGGVDGVVNNAGIYPDRRLLEMPEEEWDLVMDVNAKGTFLVCQAAGRQMVKQGGGGHIINISSGSYRFGRVGAGHYCASKAAVVMLTQVLAMELAAHGIQVNSIAPGLVASENLAPEYIESFVRTVPMGRIGQPEDIAAAVLMLLQSGCSYLTGQTIGVDGGISAGRFGLPLSGGGR